MTRREGRIAPSIADGNYLIRSVAQFLGKDCEVKSSPENKASGSYQRATKELLALRQTMCDYYMALVGAGRIEGVNEEELAVTE